jgi:radical SAM superfamily enzyme YgiQ (UPF0313 family)
LKKLNIVFANLNRFLYADGSRILSARLKAMGHHVRMVFLVDPAGGQYTEHLCGQFTELCAGADLILVSFLSETYLKAIRITEYVRKRLSIPVVWGGLHATADPEGCMNHVDILCRGEGDEALPEFISLFARGEPFERVKNFWIRRNGSIVRNEMRPLLQDLDSNPWPDYELDDHFVRDDTDRIRPMTQETLARFHNAMPLGFPSYGTLTARGCAHSCSYCYNGTFNKMFEGQQRLRFRSVESVVNEIKTVLNRFPFLKSFSLLDDDLFLRSKEDLELLADLIRERLPEVLQQTFWGCAATPAHLSEEKLDILVPAGLRAINIGVQTGSERVNFDVYNRRFKNSLLQEKAELIDRKFHKQLIILLDFIIHCPYETEGDIAETVKLICRMPSWFVTNLYRFIFYPGTPIYIKALEEGLIDSRAEVYDGIDFHPFLSKGYSFMTHVLVLTATAGYLLPGMVKKMLCSPFFFAAGKFVPRFMLDLIPWKSVYHKLWAANHKAIYRKNTIRRE